MSTTIHTSPSITSHPLSPSLSLQLVVNHALPSVFFPLATSGFPFEQTSLALSLLLVFRTDASYARWMEALALWADVRSTCTDLINDAAAWVGDERLRDLVVDW